MQSTLWNLLSVLKYQVEDTSKKPSRIWANRGTKQRTLMLGQRLSHGPVWLSECLSLKWGFSLIKSPKTMKHKNLFNWKLLVLPNNPDFPQVLTIFKAMFWYNLKTHTVFFSSHPKPRPRRLASYGGFVKSVHTNGTEHRTRCRQINAEKQCFPALLILR